VIARHRTHRGGCYVPIGSDSYEPGIQTSFNLALGSALASIGLTIPVIDVASIWLQGPLVLGLGTEEMVLLAVT
jgi:Ca2+/H+ antiporter